MSNKPIAIVLGGTIPHIELIKNLKARGYYTALVDYAQNPVAKAFADEHILESSLDKEKVLEIAKNRKAHLVITTCSDQANVTACYVAEKLGLPAPYRYETALNVTDKELMKNIMLENDIPTARFIIVDKSSGKYDFTSLKFPLIVKPIDCYGSKGVKITRDINELYENIDNAMEISRKKRVIVEEYKVGEEIGIDCFVKNHKAEIIITKLRHKIINNGDSIQQIYACQWPADILKELNDKLVTIANKIAQAFNLDNTPLMIQAIVNGNDVNVIEFGARIGGGNSYSIIKAGTGFDIIDAAVDSFLGIDVDLDFHPPKGYYADVFLYTKPAVFGYISNDEELINRKIIEYMVYNKTKGMSVGSDLSSSNRVGAFIVKAENKEELLMKIKTALAEIEVYDTFGNPIMRRDIYSI
jgi:carbamoylphosphate synthase large subunit